MGYTVYWTRTDEQELSRDQLVCIAYEAQKVADKYQAKVVISPDETSLTVSGECESLVLPLHACYCVLEQEKSYTRHAVDGRAERIIGTTRRPASRSTGYHAMACHIAPTHTCFLWRGCQVEGLRSARVNPRVRVWTALDPLISSSGPDFHLSTRLWTPRTPPKLVSSIASGRHASSA